ncbi:B-cell receptor CD22-like isoform X2, partial [Clarias magur]
MSDCSLRLSGVTEQDQGKYYFRFIYNPKEKYQELQVEMIPDSVVEGDDVTLTCKMTCSLTVTPTFTWYKTGSPSSFISSSNPLRLQSVSQRDAGSYSCAVQGESYRSPAVTLDVQWSRSVVLYVVLAIAGGCGCLFAIIAVLCIRRKRRGGSDDVVESGQEHALFNAFLDGLSETLKDELVPWELPFELDDLMDLTSMLISASYVTKARQLGLLLLLLCAALFLHANLLFHALTLLLRNPCRKVEPTFSHRNGSSDEPRGCAFIVDKQ